MLARRVVPGRSVPFPPLGNERHAKTNAGRHVLEIPAFCMTEMRILPMAAK
jgi:hypothetical protein